MHGFADIWRPRLNLGAEELLLLAPGAFLGISNFVQHAEAMGGFASRVHAVTGFALMFAAFSLSAAAPMAARRLRLGTLARKPLGQAVGHFVILAVGAPIQFFAIACAVVFIREPEFTFAEVIQLQIEFLLDCAPIWVGVYAFLVAVDSWLMRRRRPQWDATRDIEISRQSGRLSFHADGADHLFGPDEISHVRAMGDYVQIHAARRKLTVKMTLAEMETILAERGFLRVHRSALVRANAVSTIGRSSSGAYEMKLDCGAAVPLSRRRLGEVRARIAARA